MIDAGHRSTVEATLNFEKTDRVPVNNFALVTAARSAGIMVKDARFDPKVSAKVSVDYAMNTLSDYVKPVVDSQMVFADMGMQVSFPDDDYGRVEKPLAKTAEEIDDLAFFDPSKASECPKFSKCIIEALQETQRILPEDLEICGLSWGPISTAGYIMGVEDMVMDMLLEEGLAPKLVKKCAGFVAEQQKAMNEAGATLMWMADPTASGDILSPNMYDVPVGAIRDVISYYKKNCEGSAYVHICGDTTKLIPLIADTGADCMSFDHAVDPAAAREAAGDRIALMGNIDPVKYIMQSNPDTIKKVCAGIIDACGRDSGFVLAPGCETPISSPDANVRAMGEAGRVH